MKNSEFIRKIRQILPVKSCSAVIVAAGSASRMGGIDKVMAPLGGEPMLKKSIRVFQECNVINEIVVVTREDLIPLVTDLCSSFQKVTAIVAGGADRPASVQAGLSAISPKSKLVAIHDGARPLITLEVIDRTVRAAHSYGAAAPAIPVKDTIKVVEKGLVNTTPDRSTLFAVQTPQVFDADFLRVALKKAADDQAAITDDCSAVERMGMSVKIVEGDERNLKVTTPLDLLVAEKLLEDRL